MPTNGVRKEFKQENWFLSALNILLISSKSRKEKTIQTIGIFLLIFSILCGFSIEEKKLLMGEIDYGLLRSKLHKFMSIYSDEAFS